MPATRRILKHVRVEVAKARRKCHRKPVVPGKSRVGADQGEWPPSWILMFRIL